MVRLTSLLKLSAVQVVAVTLAACTPQRDVEFMESVEAARAHFYDHIEQFRALGKAIDAEELAVQIQICGNPLDRCDKDPFYAQIASPDHWLASDPEKFADLLRALDMGYGGSVGFWQDQLTQRAELTPSVMSFLEFSGTVDWESRRAGYAGLIYDPKIEFPDHDCAKIIERADESRQCIEGLSDGWALQFVLSVETRKPHQSPEE